MNSAPASARKTSDELQSPAGALRVVAIGGGTGLSTLLRGLRRHVIAPGQPAVAPGLIADLAAVVTVTDDGDRKSVV